MPATSITSSPTYPRASSRLLLTHALSVLITSTISQGQHPSPSSRISGNNNDDIETPILFRGSRYDDADGEGEKYVELCAVFMVWEAYRRKGYRVGVLDSDFGSVL